MTKVFVKVPVYAVLESEKLSQQEIVLLYRKMYPLIEKQIRKNLSPMKGQITEKEFDFRVELLIGIEPIKRRIS